MKNNHYHWAVPLTGVLLLGVGGSVFAQTQPPLEPPPALAATNRLTLSLRYAFNIDAKLRGIGSAGPGHYADGYVLPDSTGNYLGYTSYWGYNNASQYNGAVQNTFSFHNPYPGSSAAPSSSEDNSEPGVELTYDHQLGVKDDWHHLRYGVEGALNYMKFSLNTTSSYNAAVATENYTFGGIPGQIPSAGHRGSYSGNPGDPVLYATGTSGPDTTGTLVSHDDFDANIWGGRLGPYVEMPFGKQQQFTLALSGGLAAALIDANESWKQTLTLAGGAGSGTTTGGGNNVDVLWGWYAALTANYQFTEHWGLAGGLQFQDIGTYSHSFHGRIAQLDLSQSLFLELGVSYSFK